MDSEELIATFTKARAKSRNVELRADYDIAIANMVSFREQVMKLIDQAPWMQRELAAAIKAAGTRSED